MDLLFFFCAFYCILKADARVYIFGVLHLNIIFGSMHSHFLNVIYLWYSVFKSLFPKLCLI